MIYNKATTRSAVLMTLFFALSFTQAYAYDDIAIGTIRGKVIDAVTGQALPGANIYVEHTTVGTAAKANGEYTIAKAPVGNYHLVASMIGYRMEHKEFKLNVGETVIVDFHLSPTILEMGAVVVTGTGTPHLYEDTPVRTAVIPRVLIERKQATNLADALSFTTGIRVENDCQNCNFTQVRILGLGGKYSQILIDGDPVVSSLAGVYGLEQIPEEMIDQIEVIKGGGSSLYGGGAVAGVINLITRRPVTNQIHLKYSGLSMKGDMDQQIGAMAEFINEAGNSGGHIFGSTRIRNPYDHNGDDFSELGEIKNESFGFNWFYKPIQTGELGVHFHRIHELRRGGNKLDQPPHEAEIAEMLESWRSGGTIRWTHRPGPLFDYKLYYSFAYQDRNSYYGGLGGNTAADTLEALTFYGKTKNPLHVGGVQMNYRIGNQLITAGVQYSHDKVEDNAVANHTYQINETYTDIGIFLQDDFHFGPEDRFELVLGMRADKHSEIDSWIFSPRVNTKAILGSGFALRGSVTTGFKPPQTYDEDLHLCAVGGDQKVIRNTASLKEERSLSFSGGIEFQDFIGKTPVMFNLTGFVTNLSDAFTEEYDRKDGNIEVWKRVNGEGASVKGIEMDFGVQPTARVELRSGVTYQKSEYEIALEDWNTKNFLRTPDLYGYFWINIDISSKTSLFASGNFTGKAYVPHAVLIDGQEDPELILEESDSYFELDFGLSHDFTLGTGVGAKLNLGVKNITDAYQSDLDVGPNRDPAYVYGPARPRTIYSGLEISF